MNDNKRPRLSPRAVVDAVDVPVTVKMRRGQMARAWLSDLGPKLEAEGVAALT